MDNLKEKLISMIQEAVGGCARHWASLIADYLIDNGVTVQEWIPVAKRLPEKNTDVLVCTIEGYIGSDFITKDGKWFWNEETPPSHWMPLPVSPKENNDAE